MLDDEYKDIVERVYLEPIRSVLVIDDDYPSLDSLLSYDGTDQDLASALPWYNKKNEIKEVLDSLRVRKQKRRMLDVCDNLDFLDNGDDVIGHLHQCDLLVLDYEIKDHGEKALKALSTVLNNNQFNLVVVHTREQVESIFDHVLLPLIGRSQVEISDEDSIAIEEVEKKIADMANPFGKIQEAFDFGTYKFIRKLSKDITAECLDNRELSGFKAALEECAIGQDKWVSCLKHAVAEFENYNEGVFAACAKATSVLEWNDVGNHWIACPEGFISFVQKARGLDIEGHLLSALTQWKPTPTQLLFSQIRNQIDDLGIAAEISSNSNKYAHAKWYSDLLLESGQGRRQVSNSTLNKYFEIIEIKIQSGLADFINDFCLKDWTDEHERKHLSALCAAESKNAKGRIVVKKNKDIYSLANKFYNVNIDDSNQKKRSNLEHNIFVSNKSPSILHLELGHIFEADGSHWICLTPACDMIPERNKGLHNGDLKQHKPFVSVKLHKVNDEDLEKSNIQSNRFIFTKFGNFCFNLPNDEGSAPHWYPFYAHNNGYLNEGKFTYSKLNKDDGNTLSFQQVEATVKTQLRYEYAINLMTRLAANMQRVGLDYSGK